MERDSTVNRSLADVVSCRSIFEPLENRCLLDGTPPHFDTSLVDHYYASTHSLTLGVDGGDDDLGDHVAVSAVSSNPNVLVSVPTGDKFARLTFSDSQFNPVGEVVVELFTAAGGAATQRFITLATDGVNEDGTLDDDTTPFYNNVPVHRVIPGFMIQTGDALNGDGTGGSPLGSFPDAIDPVLSFSNLGALAMANSGPDTNDSQFFITDGSATWLDGKHWIFGQVISGQDIVRAISQVDRDSKDRPLDMPYLTNVDIFDSYQDGSVVVQAVNGFVGDANVTVTLTDAEGNHTSKQVEMTFEGDLHVAPGSTTTYSVDLSGLTGPTIASSLTTAAVSLDTVNGTATVTVPAGYTGMFSVSISDNATSTPQVVRSTDVISRDTFDPLVFGRVQASSGSSVLCTRQVGDLLYVGRQPTTSDGNGGLDIYNVSDPAKPVLLSRLEGMFYYPGTTDTVDRFLIHDIEVKGNTLIAATTLSIWSGGQNYVEEHLLTFDVSNPAKVKVLGGTSLVQGLDVCVDGNLALVTGGQDHGVFAFDITDPTDIVPLGESVNLVPGVKISYAIGVEIRNGFAFVNANIDENGQAGAGVVVLDVTDEHAIKFSGFFQAGSPWDIDLDGSILYVADNNGALVAFDVSNPKAVKYINHIAVTGGPVQVEVGGGLAVVTTGSGYALFDVTNPKKILPRAVLNNGLSEGRHVSVNGQWVALPLGGDGWVMLDDKFTRIVGKQTLLDEHGTAVTFNVKGGQLVVDTSGFVGGQFRSMDVIASNGSTTVSITSKAEFTIGDITVHGSLGSLTAKLANLAGDMTVEGTIATLTLGDFAGGRIDLNSLGAAVDPKLSLSLTLDQVKDCLLNTHGIPIKSLSAAQWLNTDGDATNDRIIAPSMAKLSVKYDFAAGMEIHCSTGLSALGCASIGGNVAGDLWDISGGSLDKLSVKGNMGTNLTIAYSGVKPALGNASISGNVTGGLWDISGGSLDKLTVTGSMGGNLKLNYSGLKPALGSASVGGDLAGRVWDVLGAVGKITVTGKIDDSVIRSTGNVTSITAGAIYDSDILAGFDSTFTARHADDHGDFAGRPLSIISSISIKGLKLPTGVTPPAFYMDNVNVTSSKIGKVCLINADFTDCGLFLCQNPLGGEVASVKHTDTVLKKTWVWPSTSMPNAPAGFVNIL